MLSIRKAVAEDALGITIVNVYTWKTTYSGLIPDFIIDSRIADLKRRAKKCEHDIEKNNHTVVAEIEKTIVGFCSYGESRKADYKNAGEIYALYVLNDYQGMRMGKALFLAGVKELVSEGYSSIIINCIQNNPSIEFYKHMGGKIVGQRQDMILGCCISEDIMYYEDMECLK